MKKLFLLLGIFVLASCASSQVFADNNDPLIQSIVDSLKRNTALANEFGAHQRVVTTRLREDGTPMRVEEKYLRTIWLSDKPKNVLIRVSCQDFESPIRNSSACVEFTKAANQKDTKPGRIESETKKVRWTEMYNNFEFQMLPEEGTYHVLSFRPKKSGISAENRIEKLLSQMAGKVWIDKQFNIVKAEAKLVSPVSFGLGVAAKVHYIGIQYRQQPVQGVWMPSYLNLEFKAKVALIHTEKQRIEVSWTEPYRRSNGVWAQAETPLKTGATKASLKGLNEE